MFKNKVNINRLAGFKLRVKKPFKSFKTNDVLEIERVTRRGINIYRIKQKPSMESGAISGFIQQKKLAIICQSANDSAVLDQL